MSSAALFGYCGAVLVGLGLYGLITRPEVLRKILSFNVLGSGVFLLFGVFARRGAAAGLGADPVPQALVITGIVVGVFGNGSGCRAAGSTEQGNRSDHRHP
jgi:multicomponent Na+:H+ antiporter subunit C